MSKLLTQPTSPEQLPMPSAETQLSIESVVGACADLRSLEQVGPVGDLVRRVIRPDYFSEEYYGALERIDSVLRSGVNEEGQDPKVVSPELFLEIIESGLVAYRKGLEFNVLGESNYPGFVVRNLSQLPALLTQYPDRIQDVVAFYGGDNQRFSLFNLCKLLSAHGGVADPREWPTDRGELTELQRAIVDTPGYEDIAHVYNYQDIHTRLTEDDAKPSLKQINAAAEAIFEEKGLEKALIVEIQKAISHFIIVDSRSKDATDLAPKVHTDAAARIMTKFTELIDSLGADNICELYRQFGIVNAHRYNEGQLRRMLAFARGDQELLASLRETGVSISILARDDHNGAFEKDAANIDAMTEDTALFFEASDYAGIINAVNKVREADLPINNFILGAHGSDRGISLQHWVDAEDRRIHTRLYSTGHMVRDHTDRFPSKDFAEALTKAGLRGLLILAACSQGLKREAALDGALAEDIAQYLPEGSKVFATIKPSSYYVKSGYNGVRYLINRSEDDSGYGDAVIITNGKNGLEYQPDFGPLDIRPPNSKTRF